ncbi:MAG: hypothetical protein ABFC96_10140 [Thermoguttaceae bacterium]
MNYEFTVILANLDEMTTELAEALFAAGCDDGHPWSSDGVAAITFDRHADSLIAAVRSAIADVQKAGCTVRKVEIEPEVVLA